MEVIFYEQLIEKLFKEIEIFFSSTKFLKIINDIEFSEDSIVIELKDSSKYLINKHLTTRKLWVSSPISGGFKFSYDSNNQEWKNKNNQELFEFFTKELLTNN